MSHIAGKYTMPDSNDKMGWTQIWEITQDIIANDLTNLIDWQPVINAWIDLARNKFFAEGHINYYNTNSSVDLRSIIKDLNDPDNTGYITNSFPIATETLAGAITGAAFKQIFDNAAAIVVVQDLIAQGVGSGRVAWSLQGDFADNNSPTDIELTNVFLRAFPDSDVKNGDIIINRQNYYFKYMARGVAPSVVWEPVDSLHPATSDVLGGVKSTSDNWSNEGMVYVEPGGQMSVIGWDALNNKIINHQSQGKDIVNISDGNGGWAETLWSSRPNSSGLHNIPTGSGGTQVNLSQSGINLQNYSQNQGTVSYHSQMYIVPSEITMSDRDNSETYFALSQNGMYSHVPFNIQSKGKITTGGYCADLEDVENTGELGKRHIKTLASSYTGEQIQHLFYRITYNGTTTTERRGTWNAPQTTIADIDYTGDSTYSRDKNFITREYLYSIFDSMVASQFISRYRPIYDCNITDYATGTDIYYVASNAANKPSGDTSYGMLINQNSGTSSGSQMLLSHMQGKVYTRIREATSAYSAWVEVGGGGGSTSPEITRITVNVDGEKNQNTPYVYTVPVSGMTTNSVISYHGNDNLSSALEQNGWAMVVTPLQNTIKVRIRWLGTNKVLSSCRVIVDWYKNATITNKI